MRRSTFITLATALVGTSALFGSSAFAADAGTYRPGNAYNSITANAPNICEMQCSGDAQCRSWNFVRLSEMAEGVCEFNDNTAAPVPSAISVSGNNVTRARNSQLVTGKTNTVRIGAPSVTQPKATLSQPSAAQRVVREPISQRIDPRASSYQTRQHNTPPQHNAHLSLMEQQRRNSAAQRAPAARQPHGQTAPRLNPNAAGLRHSLEEGGSAASARPYTQQPSAQRAPQNYAHADPRLQQRLHSAQRGTVVPQASAQTTRLNSPAPAMASPERSGQGYGRPQQLSTPQNYAASAGGLSAPPGVPPLSQGANTQPMQAPNSGLPSSYMAPKMAGAPMPPRRVNIPSELSPRPMGSGDSLFGSLYDDVKVPRPIDPAMAENPDAPIATVSSVPTAQIYSAPLPPVR